MKLHDTHRPTLNERPCYLNGWTVIQPPQVWPMSDPALVEISVMLPIRGEGFAAKWFRRRVEIETIQSWIEWFADNPETCLEDLFADDMFQPNLRAPITEAKSGLKPEIKPEPELAPDLSELDEVEA
jgi:hypothetical protein